MCDIKLNVLQLAEFEKSRFFEMCDIFFAKISQILGELWFRDF